MLKTVRPRVWMKHCTAHTLVWPRHLSTKLQQRALRLTVVSTGRATWRSKIYKNDASLSNVQDPQPDCSSDFTAKESSEHQDSLNVTPHPAWLVICSEFLTHLLAPSRLSAPSIKEAAESSNHGERKCPACDQHGFPGRQGILSRSFIRALRHSMGHWW